MGQQQWVWESPHRNLEAPSQWSWPSQPPKAWEWEPEASCLGSPSAPHRSGLQLLDGASQLVSLRRRFRYALSQVFPAATGGGLGKGSLHS